MIQFLIEHPECIAQVSVKKEKEYRPWTEEEFETHRDEWFRKKEDNRISRPISCADNFVSFNNYTVSLVTLFAQYERIDGSPCGEEV